MRTDLNIALQWAVDAEWGGIMVFTHLHSSRLDSGFVTELNKGHQHGKPKPTNQNVENSSHITEAQSAGLILQSRDDNQTLAL